VTVSEGPVAGDAGERAEGAGTDRLLTLPNIISIVRLACLPIFLYLLFGRDNRAAAAGLLAGLGATDWIDGYIARHWDQVSELGKVLDPVADRLLFFVGVGGILAVGAVPAWFAVAVLVREFVVGAVTVLIALLGARRADVTWWGKAGTFALMFAFPLFLASHSTLGWRHTAHWLAWAWGIPGLILSYIAWALYVPIGIRALSEGRADRRAGAVGNVGP
jgi:cardiolipin synthase